MFLSGFHLAAERSEMLCRRRAERRTPGTERRFQRYVSWFPLSLFLLTHCVMGSLDINCHWAGASLCRSLSLSFSVSVCLCFFLSSHPVHHCHKLQSPSDTYRKTPFTSHYSCQPTANNVLFRSVSRCSRDLHQETPQRQGGGG